MTISSTPQYPQTRLRRLRHYNFLHELCAEHRLSAQDLILPLFVCDNHPQELVVKAMAGIKRVPLNQLAKTGQQIQQAGIPAVALFPVVSPKDKSPLAQEALNEDGLIPQAVRILKAACPDLGVMVDVALDPYTSSGHDGLTNAAGEVVNDATVEVLCQQALCLAKAGADLLAPSDMMDGRIGAIRKILDAHGYEKKVLLSYAAKYASALYSPFRAAIGSAANLGGRNKRGYQMDPANSSEALREVALDLNEGADIVMVKPGLFYLDVVHRVKQQFGAPTFVYQVSGEYTMLKLLGAEGGDYTQLMLESLVAYKRAGADAIITYSALEAAEALGT